MLSDDTSMEKILLLPSLTHGGKIGLIGLCLRPKFGKQEIKNAWLRGKFDHGEIGMVVFQDWG